MVKLRAKTELICLLLQLPGEIKLTYFNAEGNMQELTVEELTKGKKVSQHTPTTTSKAC